ncbi:MAG: phosphoglucosamine mutase [Gammaproteobacteria bacterium]|nr:MAG: phosphoglucosamine mutase [Gammaproteobacteria bacterium]
MGAAKRYFGTDGIRGRVGEPPITADFVLKLGWAAGRVLGQALAGGPGKVLIGKDTRISGYMFESALQAGLSAAGVDIRLLGPMPTPAIAYLTRTLHAQAGIVISASHNPYYDNGIKFFSAQGTKLPDELELAIEAELERPMETVGSARLGKAERVVDAAGRYIEFCKSTIPASTELRGLKLVVDCAHGATYHVAPAVFAELGAEVVALGVEPDGLNINEGCGSTRPRAAQMAVLEHGADLGIALDGDGDRVILVDHRGEIVDGDELLFIIAQARHRQGRLRGEVVGTVMSNLGLEQALRARGIGFRRTPVGDRHVLEVLEREGWTLGGESSGHIICRDRTTTGDGIVSALQVLREMLDTGLSLHELKKGMVKHPQCLVNVRLPRRGLDLAGHPRVDAACREAEARLAGEGRVLLRPSGTEPVLRVMVEGADAVAVERLAQELAEAVREAAEGL